MAVRLHPPPGASRSSSPSRPQVEAGDLGTAQPGAQDEVHDRPVPQRPGMPVNGGRLAAAASSPPRVRLRKADYLSRLAKIEGQVRGLQKMVAADTYCPDVVVQVASVTWALQEVAVGLLTDHPNHCVVNAARASQADGQASPAEVASTIRQVIRL